MYIALEIIRFIINAFIITTLVDIVLMGRFFLVLRKGQSALSFL